MPALRSLICLVFFASLLFSPQKVDAYGCGDNPYLCAELPPGTALLGGYDFDVVGGSLQGWTGVDLSGAGDFTDVTLYLDLPPALSACTCGFNDYVLTLGQEISPGTWVHPDGQDNFAQSPWIDLSSWLGYTGRLIVFDAYFYTPVQNYVFPKVLVQWKIGGVPSAWTEPDSPLNIAGAECSAPGDPFIVDVSSVVPSNAEEVRIGLGVENNCSSFGDCTGVTESSPWYDNIYFGVYPDAFLYADSDGDGVTDNEESQGPNSGDGNNDGEPDQFQPNVVSVREFGSSQFFVLELPQPVIPGAGPPIYSFRCVETIDPQALTPPPPGWCSFPCEGLSFRAAFRQTGSAPIVGVYVTYPSGCNPNSYCKLNSGAWMDFTHNGTTGTLISPGTANLYIEDNARGDDDTIPFMISDPGGVAIVNFDCTCDPIWFDTGDLTPRHQHATAYDSLRQEIVLFGGYDGTSNLDDTWVWNGYNWIQKFPATVPPSRRGASMAFHEGLGVTVLHGGYDGSSNLTDTWAWDGSDWSLYPASGPSLRNAAMEYDRLDDVLVHYGGNGDTGRSSATWEFDGTTWTKIITSSAPGARNSHSMAYDDEADRIIMHGGVAPGGVEQSDTWSFNGSTNTWTDLSLTGPSARGEAAMVHDPGCGRTYLYGGEDDGVIFEDWWVLESGAWTQLDSSASPGMLRSTALDYHRGMDHFILTAGSDGTDEQATYWQYGCLNNLVSVPDEGRKLVSHSGHPNPFRSSVTISYTLDRSTATALRIYDLSGRLIRTLRSGEIEPPGAYEVVWDGVMDSGRPAAAGVYFYRLELGDRETSGRMVRIQ